MLTSFDKAGSCLVVPPISAFVVSPPCAGVVLVLTLCDRGYVVVHMIGFILFLSSGGGPVVVQTCPWPLVASCFPCCPPRSCAHPAFQPGQLDYPAWLWAGSWASCPSPSSHWLRRCGTGHLQQVFWETPEFAAASSRSYPVSLPFQSLSA